MSFKFVPNLLFRKALNAVGAVAPLMRSNRFITAQPLIKSCYSTLASGKSYLMKSNIKNNLANIQIVRHVKTKQAAAKRFRVTGGGKLKFGHQGKSHNTSKKTKIVKRRLNKKGILKGTFLKNMLKLVNQ